MYSKLYHHYTNRYVAGILTRLRSRS